MGSFFLQTLVTMAQDFANLVKTFSSSLLRDTPDFLLVIFVLIGFIAFFNKFWSYLRLLWSLFLASGKPLRSYGKKGSWVVITGASDGIGKEFATQIARQGFNLLLVSRTQSKLDDLARQIETSDNFYKAKVQTLAIDFASATEDDYERLGKAVRDLDVSILINNVGLSHKYPEPFAITDIQDIKDIIQINCLATLRVTQLVLPGLIQRKRGLVLTLGSFGGLIPSPLLATYSGSKAFLQHWSSALASELDGSGIDVQFIVPYLITSAMSKIRKPSFFIPTPKAFVRSVLTRIGRRGGSTHYAYSSTPYPTHALMQWWVENTLGSGSQTIIAHIRGMHQGIRARALRKIAREAKSN